MAFVSEEALRYVTADTLEWSTVNPVVQRITPAAEHLSDAAPFDAYLVAPATYNTINKMASGIADGVVTSAVAAALGRLERGQTAVLVAPTRHGSLHNRILECRGEDQSGKPQRAWLVERGQEAVAVRLLWTSQSREEPAGRSLVLCLAVSSSIPDQRTRT